MPPDYFILLAAAAYTATIQPWGSAAWPVRMASRAAPTRRANASSAKAGAWAAGGGAETMGGTELRLLWGVDAPDDRRLRLTPPDAAVCRAWASSSSVARTCSSQWGC